MSGLPAQLGPWWPSLIKAAERGGYTEEDVLRKIADGHTVVIEDPRFLMLLDRATDGACVVWLCAGERVADWHGEIAAKVAPWAKANGCDRYRIEGRRGWVRALPHWTMIAEQDGEVTLELAI